MYYRCDAALIAASSEPDSLVSLAPVTPDEIYLSSVIKFGYCPETRRTPYAEIKKTLPGEHVVMTPSGHVTRKIADPLSPSNDYGPAQLRWEIDRAVARRVLSSDVPVAALVSGGLDSAITYTLAQRHGDVRAYHVENGERAAAESVVYSMPLAPVDFGPEPYRLPPAMPALPRITMLDCKSITFEKALQYMQEPLDLGSLMPQVALSDAIAASGAERVCLTGDGADEFFGGYGRAARYDSQHSDVFHELVAWHLPRLDRVMMRNKIEARSPFLARRVATIALGLPRALRTDKKILRDLFRDDLPFGVANQPKRALRTKAVEEDREGTSRRLVDMFREKTWPGARQPSVKEMQS